MGNSIAAAMQLEANKPKGNEKRKEWRTMGKAINPNKGEAGDPQGKLGPQNSMPVHSAFIIKCAFGDRGDCGTLCRVPQK